MYVLHHCAKFGGIGTSHAAGGNQKCCVFCLSSGLSVTLSNGKVCPNNFAQNALERRSGSDIFVNRERFVVVHTCTCTRYILTFPFSSYFIPRKGLGEYCMLLIFAVTWLFLQLLVSKL